MSLLNLRAVVTVVVDNRVSEKRFPNADEVLVILSVRGVFVCLNKASKNINGFRVTQAYVFTSVLKIYIFNL